MLNIGFIFKILQGSGITIDIPNIGGLIVNIQNGETITMKAPDYNIDIFGKISTNRVTNNTKIVLQYAPSNVIEFRGRVISDIELRKSKMLGIPELYYGDEKFSKTNGRRILTSIFGRKFIDKYHKEFFK